MACTQPVAAFRSGQAAKSPWGCWKAILEFAEWESFVIRFHGRDWRHVLSTNSPSAQPASPVAFRARAQHQTKGGCRGVRHCPPRFET